MRYLGIHISSDLSWSPYVTNLCKKARRLIGLLYQKSFIRPHFEYCSIVWDSNLMVILNCLRRSDPKVHSSSLPQKLVFQQRTTVTQSNIPALIERRTHAKLCHMYRIVMASWIFQTLRLSIRLSTTTTCRHSHPL